MYELEHWGLLLIVLAAAISTSPAPVPKPRKPRTTPTEKEIRAKLRDVDQKRFKERKQRIANDKKIKMLNSSLTEKTKLLDAANLALGKAVLERSQALEQAQHDNLREDAQERTEISNLCSQNAVLKQQVSSLQNAHHDAEKATVRLEELQVELRMRDQKIRDLMEENTLLKPEVEKLKAFKAAISNLT